MYLKKKFLTSRSIPGNNKKTTSSLGNRLSQIQIMDNITNRSQLSDISSIYATPFYENDEEIETSIPSRVVQFSRHRTSIINTQNKPFDIELNGFDIIPKASEDIYSEPYYLEMNGSHIIKQNSSENICYKPYAQIRN